MGYYSMDTHVKKICDDVIEQMKSQEDEHTYNY